MLRTVSIPSPDSDKQKCKANKLISQIKQRHWFKPVLNKERTCEITKKPIFYHSSSHVPKWRTNYTRRDHWEIARRSGEGTGKSITPHAPGILYHSKLESQHSNNLMMVIRLNRAEKNFTSYLNIASK